MAKLLHLCDGPTLGGILGDEMGLGKTLQVIVTLIMRKNTVHGCADLVVAPKATLSQWMRELHHIDTVYAFLDC